MSSQYKKNIYHLLTNKELIILSYNQILDCPDNLVFDINLRYYLSKDKKIFLQNQIVKSIQKDIFVFLNNKASDSFIFKKQKNVLFKSFSLKSLIIKQIMANILTKIFSNVQQDFPHNFQIIKKRKDVEHKLKKAVKDTTVGIQLKNLHISNNASLARLIKMVTRVTNDKRFINLFTYFVRNLSFNDFAKKSSKFYRTLCNIFLMELDQFVIYLCKTKLSLSIDFFLKKRNLKNQVESLVSKALIFAKKNNFFYLKKILNSQNKLIKTTPIFYYIRYFEYVFFGVFHDSIKSNFLNINATLDFFCKSHLHLDLKKTSWINLEKDWVNFFALNNKKITQKFCRKTDFIKEQRFIDQFAPLRCIKKELLKFKIIHNDNKPKALDNLIGLYTKSIITWYNYLLLGLVCYYKRSRNQKKLEYRLYYFFKWSLLYTLRKKHKKSIKKVVFKYFKTNNTKKQLILKQKPAGLPFIKEHLRFFISLNYLYSYNFMRM